MDRLSYKDGYLTGIWQTLNTLLEDGIISKQQYKVSWDKLNDNDIVIPESYQFYKRKYIDELKKIKREKDYMQKIIPLIKEIDKMNIYTCYKFKNMHEMLVNGVGIKKSTASEILLISDCYYNSDGSIKPEWKDFGTKNLLFLARRYKENNIDIYALRKSNILRPTMSFTEIENICFYENSFISYFLQ